MKISRFTDSQIMAILKQNEAGASVPDLCREHGISSASVYKWRTKMMKEWADYLDTLRVNQAIQGNRVTPAKAS